MSEHFEQRLSAAAKTFGAELRRARGSLTYYELRKKTGRGDPARGVSESTIKRLEAGGGLWPLADSRQLHSFKSIVDALQRHPGEFIRHLEIEQLERANVLDLLPEGDVRTQGVAASQSPRLPTLADSEARYRRHMLDSYEMLDFKGIVQTERLPMRISLHGVYVEPRLLNLDHLDDGREHRSTDQRSLVDAIERRAARIDQPAEEPELAELLANSEGIVILGDPGAGKSTVLKHLAVCAARQEYERIGLDRDYVPILVPITAYAAAVIGDSTTRIRNRPQSSDGASTALVDFLAAYYQDLHGQSADLRTLFTSVIHDGRALILLDGLDEITDQTWRIYITRRVEDLFRRVRTGGNKLVVTSRIVGYRDAPVASTGLGHYVICQFERSQIRAFATNWCRELELAVRGSTVVAESAAAVSASVLYDDIVRNPSVEQLATNPLLLTLLALIHRQGIELPTRRVELYELCVSTLISSWARARNLDGRPINPMDAVAATKVLAPLAYWLRSAKGPAGVAHEEELVRRVAEYYRQRRDQNVEEADTSARGFLHDVRYFSGLLAERGPAYYGFLHPTFEEYLCARYILLEGQVDFSRTTELLRPLVANASWREVIRLAVGFESIVAKAEDRAAAIVDAIRSMETLDSECGEAVLAAAECVADVGLEGVGPECFSATCAAVVKLLETAGVLQERRWRAGMALDHMGDPRFARHRIIPEVVNVMGAEFLMGTPSFEIERMCGVVDSAELTSDTEWVRAYWTRTLRSESPPSTISVEAFAIGRYPVTNTQYQAFVDETPEVDVPYCDDVATARLCNWDRRTRRHPIGRGNHPVVLVSWRDAIAYLRWLSAKTGRTFRLPTEAEWEYAMRGTKSLTYPWGNDWKDDRANTVEAAAGSTTPVGAYPSGRSDFGAEDGAGQVWEWTSTAWGNDWRVAEYDYPYRRDQREREHPSKWRIVRGGSWDDIWVFARAAARGPNLETFRSHYIGFRVAESPIRSD